MSKTASRIAKEAKKLAWLRRCVEGPVPDIYSMKNFEPNGCSFAPDRIGRCLLTPACDWHDYRYYIGGSREDRHRVDLELYHLLNRRSAEFHWLFRWFVRGVAHTYYFHVRVYGERFWNRRTATHC